jgi:hypothetical protein
MRALEMTQPAVSHGSEAVSVTFKKMAHDSELFNKTKVQEEIVKRITGLGLKFLGTYTVLVGEVLTKTLPNFRGDIIWKHHDYGQKGIGFVVKETSLIAQIFPARSFSLIPPLHVDVEELCSLLQDKVVDIRSKLKAGPPASNDSAVVSTATGAQALALALTKVNKHKSRLDKSLANRKTLEQEIARLKVEIAKQPSLDYLVAERLKALGL